MFNRIGLLLLTAFLFLVSILPASAQERIGIGYSLADDGGCPETMQSLTFEYDYKSDGAMDAHGMVRSAPSGGDCTQPSLSYNVGMARYFPMGALDVVVEFGADHQSAQANYDLLHEDGTVQLRSDGNALMTVPLPAGAVTTIVGSVGLSRDFGPIRVNGGYNFAPADWAIGGMVLQGRTARFGADFDWRGLYADAEIDVGRVEGQYPHFGGFQGGYRWSMGDRSDISIGVVHRWGLNALDNGAPELQSYRGPMFRRAGAPRDHATFLNITIGYSLGG